MNHLRKYTVEIAVSLAMAALWVWFLVLLTAPPADAQELEQRCTVQTFDPPLASGWAMPGDADTVSIMFTDGTGRTLTGPFALGDIITHPGQVARSIEKCTAVGVFVPPEPTPTVVPPTPEPTPTTVPTPTPPSDDSCCTTIVTPGPTVTPTPIIPTPPTPPVDPTPTPEVPTATPETPTPTPDVPTLPETGASSALLGVIGVALLGAGGVLMAARR